MACLFDTLDDPLLTYVCRFVPTRDLVTATGAASWRFARAADFALREACQELRWSLPRRSRLISQQGGPAAELKWRTLFVLKSCPGCIAKPGDFAVRTMSQGAPLCFLCAECCKADHIVQKLQRQKATLDVTGLSGKALYTRRGSKFANDVHEAAKRAL